MNRPLRRAEQILIVDDHEVVVQGLKFYLMDEEKFNICGSATNLHDGLKKIEELQPDIVIVDLTLENSSGMDLMKDLRIRYPRIKMLVMSMHDELIYAERALRAGAKGYIMKDQSLKHVIEALHVVQRGGTYVSERVKERMINRMMDTGGQAPSSMEEILSEREMEVFLMIGKGYRPRHIAEKLNMSVTTVNTHCKRIRQKLRLENMEDLIQCATEHLSH